jgi:hypothetical protein
MGRWSWRWSPRLRWLLISFAILMVGIVGASLGHIVPMAVEEMVSFIGGATVICCWMALVLLGIVWAAPRRHFSSTFLVLLGLIAAILILLDSGARLWWRYGMPHLWEMTADASGGLVQSTSSTCSPACAVMLLNYYGIPASEGEMAYLANTTLFGTDAYAMARALTGKMHGRGYQARVDTSDYDGLIGQGSPFIAHVRLPKVGAHALLVRKTTARFVEVIDPLVGIPERMSRADFEAIWDGSLVRAVRVR